MSDRRTILVSGGGIAGLTAALCLAESGHRVEIFEKANKFETLGAGIQLSPNALRVLFSLGLEKKLKTVATAPPAINLIDARTAQRLANVPLGHHVINRYGLPYLVIHRADLQQILVKACRSNPEIALHLGSEVMDVAPHKNGATVLVNRDDKFQEVPCRAVIVADGIWSRIRTQILGLEAPEYQGLTAWRSMIPIDENIGFSARENTELWLAKKSHAVTYPVRMGRYLNVVAIVPESDPDGIYAKPNMERLASHFSNWHNEFAKLLDCRTRWTSWPLYQVTKLTNMAYGPIVMIGDAAHAMLPFAAQGAAMAIEDATSLALHLADNQDAPEAFMQFEKYRLPRLRKAMALAKFNRSIYHMDRPFSWFRNLGLRLIPNESLLGRQNWLYKWEPGTRA